MSCTADDPSAVSGSSRFETITISDKKIPFAPYAAAFWSVTLWPRRSSWATRRLVVLSGSRRW
jgi:hypothetical protein